MQLLCHPTAGALKGYGLVQGQEDGIMTKARMIWWPITKTGSVLMVLWMTGSLITPLIKGIPVAFYQRFFVPFILDVFMGGLWANYLIVCLIRVPLVYAKVIKPSAAPRPELYMITNLRLILWPISKTGSVLTVLILVAFEALCFAVLRENTLRGIPPQAPMPLVLLAGLWVAYLPILLVRFGLVLLRVIKPREGLTTAN